jgi:Zn-dependent protease
MANKFVGPTLAAITIFMKSTKLLAVLKSVSFAKPLITVISMLISAIVYGLWLGPWFGIGLVGIIFVHEMGHIIALRQRGYETPGPVFIPFLGAAIFAPKFEDRDTEAYVAFGGPLIGTLFALITFIAWYVTGSEIMIMLTYIGVFLNLFNMLPISPLDGGRITQAVGSWFKWIGLGLLLAYSFLMAQPSILLIWILILDSFENMPLRVRPILAGLITVVMGVFMLLGYGSQPLWVNWLDIFLACFFVWMFNFRDNQRVKNPEEEEKPDLRPAATPAQRRKWLVCFIGLTAVLAGLLVITVGHLPQKVKTDAATMAAPTPEKQ